MSDDEAFLEFKIGEPVPNPWEDSSSTPKSPVAKQSPLPQTPEAPANSKTKFSLTELSPSGFTPSGSKKADLEFENIDIDDLSSKFKSQLKAPFDNDEPATKQRASEAQTQKESGPNSLPATNGTDFATKLDEVSLDEATNRPEEASEQHPIQNPQELAENPSKGNNASISPDKPMEEPQQHPEGDSASKKLDDKASPASNHSEDPSDPPPAYSQEEAPRPLTDSPRSVNFDESQNSRDGNKYTHSRGSSHVEYYQGSTGDIQKRHIDDESGLTVDKPDGEEDSWEQMATVGSFEIYDDKNNLLMEKYTEDNSGVENAAASGYTRVANNDDAKSITSLDDKTDFLFDAHKPDDDVDADFQMAATKSMLTDQQKIAYAGLCRLALAEIANKFRNYGAKSSSAVESLQIWGSKFILSLYNHLGLSHEEQLMIESLAAHNLLADDLTPCLKQIQMVTDDGIITKEVATEPNGAPEPVSDKGSDSSKTPPGSVTKDDRESTNSQKLTPDDKKDNAIAKEYELDVNDLHEGLPTTQEMDHRVDVDVKWTVMCDLFLVLLAEGDYDARARTLLTLIACKLGLTANDVAQFERKVTDVLQIDDNADQDWTEQDIIEVRRRKALRKKYAYVGLATVGGGLVIGLSGGLLAPVVGAGLAGALGTIGIAGTGGFLAGVGGTAIITTASTAIGAHVGSKSMLRRVGHVKTFEFRPIFNNNRVNLVITVSGWMTGKEDDVRLPFSTIDPLVGDVMSVLWEPEMMRSLGQTMNILATEALAFGVQQILGATIFTVLMASLQAPMWLSKLSYLVDNPWSVSLDRAWAAGLILADTLMKRKLGQRPATLVGYSLGARVIYSCITELARNNAYGLVQDVYLYGTPVFYNKKHFAKARSAVSGRYINGYSRKDWILAFLFPAAKRYGSVLGLDAVPEQESELLDIENVDVSDLVDGHMTYRAKMPTILKESGWPVLSEEFDEIEDPDPDQLREKQLKLLDELDSAEKKPKKSGFFSSWGLDFMQRAKSKSSSANHSREGSPSVINPSAEGETLFDIDAIRNEMQSLKPRMVFEQEPMPLPEHDEENMPIELLESEVEPVVPATALDYDDPGSKKPAASGSPKRPTAPAAESKSDKKEDKSGIVLQFDDLE